MEPTILNQGSWTGKPTRNVERELGVCGAQAFALACLLVFPGKGWNGKTLNPKP